MAQDKKFISPQAWFFMTYPAEWSEFEDSEGTFLFYNPDVWTGNFRISAFREERSKRGNEYYAQDVIRQELKENPEASIVKIAGWECAYSQELFEENETDYVNHVWITGVGNMAFECSFTSPEGESIQAVERIIASLSIRHEDEKYSAELIPIRLSEICLVNEAYEFIVNLVKDELKKDFQGTEEDLPKIQQLVDSATTSIKKRDEWLALGITLCVILVNEVEELEWMTLIDGNREVPVLQYKGGEKMIDPLKLGWSKIKAGENCVIEEAYKNALA